MTTSIIIFFYITFKVKVCSGHWTQVRKEKECTKKLKPILSDSLPNTNRIQNFRSKQRGTVYDARGPSRSPGVK